MQDFNRKIIEEFRANEGVVGGQFEGLTLLLLGTIGAKSGAARTNPLIYLREGDRLIVFASAGGAPKNPPWYYNLRANPKVTVEVGVETFGARAEVLDEPERTQIYDKMASKVQMFADYREKAGRAIPVIALTRL